MCTYVTCFKVFDCLVSVIAREVWCQCYCSCMGPVDGTPVLSTPVKLAVGSPVSSTPVEQAEGSPVLSTSVKQADGFPMSLV